MNATTRTEATPAANHAKKLGVDICDCCGRPPAIVGPVNTNEKMPGLCAYCAHDLARFDVLTDELVPILRDWYRACLDRDITSGQIEDIVDSAVDRLATEARAEPVTA